MLYLDRSAMCKCLSMKEAIEADKLALKAYTEGNCNVPLRTNIDIAKHAGQALYMPAYVGGEQEASGIKIVSVYPENSKRNLPAVPATMIVLDPETGIATAILDGTYLTQLRTGAVQGAATDLLARKDAQIGALIGTGGQALSQLEAMLAVRDLCEVRVSSLNYEMASDFVDKVKANFPAVKLVPCGSAKECVEGADIITTVTTSREATFEASWVKPGAHINGIGAYTPQMCEVPAEIIQKADCIIFDTMEGVLAEAGDFIAPLEKGLVDKSAYTGELGELVLGKVKGRQSADDITIFKTVGSAVLDVFVAAQIVNKAKELGLGKEIA